MSMSTDISDLPGAELEFQEDDYIVEENEMPRDQRGLMPMQMGPMQMNQSRETYGSMRSQNTPNNSSSTQAKEYYENIDDEPINNSEPVLNFKKKINMEYNMQTIFDSIKKELNLTNLLLLFVIFFATTSTSNEYVRKGLNFIPFTSGSGYSHMSVLIIKSFVLLVAFILINNLILPYLKD